MRKSGKELEIELKRVRELDDSEFDILTKENQEYSEEFFDELFRRYEIWEKRRF